MKSLFGMFAAFCVLLCGVTAQAAFVTVDSPGTVAPGIIDVTVNIGTNSGESFNNIDMSFAITADAAPGTPVTMATSVAQGTIWAQPAPVLTTNPALWLPSPASTTAVEGVQYSVSAGFFPFATTPPAGSIDAVGQVATFSLDLTTLDPALLNQPLTLLTNYLGRSVVTGGTAVLAAGDWGTGSLTVTPEPSSLLLGMGAVAVVLGAGYRRRRKAKKN